LWTVTPGGSMPDWSFSSKAKGPTSVGEVPPSDVVHAAVPLALRRRVSVPPDPAVTRSRYVRPDPSLYAGSWSGGLVGGSSWAEQLELEVTVGCETGPVGVVGSDPRVVAVVPAGADGKGAVVPLGAGPAAPG
jgi:hypothetical protein